jgi:head-tail adaptor
VTLFDDNELAGLRAAQESHMSDTCQVGVRSLSPDAFGELIETYTYGSSIRCGVGPAPPSETLNPDATIVRDDRKIRLPSGTAIDATSRVRVTHRLGGLLATPEVYDVQGTPFEGPSGVEATCRRTVT